MSILRFLCWSRDYFLSHHLRNNYDMASMKSKTYLTSHCAVVTRVLELSNGLVENFTRYTDDILQKRKMFSNVKFTLCIIHWLKWKGGAGELRFLVEKYTKMIDHQMCTTY